MTQTDDLVDGAYGMGRAAGRERLHAGDVEAPRLTAPPVAQARYLLGRDGTLAELEVVADAWERGVADEWSSRFGGSNGG